MNQQHDQDQQACQDNQSGLQDAIAALNQKIQDASAEVNAKTGEADAVTAARDAQQSVIDNIQPYLNQITAQRNQDQQDFEAQDEKNSQIIAVLQRTEQFITERLEARQAEQGSSFLEKNNVLIEVKATVMSADFQKMSPGWGSLINFLATKALHKLKQDEDVAAVAGLQSIVNLIDQLIADQNLLKANAQNANDQAKANFETESAALQSQIDVATNAVANSNAQVNTLRDRIAELNSLINASNESVANNKDALYQSQRDCSNADDQYSKAYTSRY